MRTNRRGWAVWQKIIIAFLFLCLCVIFFILFVLLFQTNSSFQTILSFPTPLPSTPTQNWRLSPNYVSEKQFGKDWPLTVSEGTIVCNGPVVLIRTSNGTFGLTGYSVTAGYTDIKESGILKRTDDGWGYIPISKLVSYSVDLCNKQLLP